MPQTTPFRAVITEAKKQDLEQFAKQDGVQRGAFFDTSGKLRFERVSATATHSWLFKTTNGKPHNWEF